ncbi:hypothetical protein K474DRAFT_1661466 [Panus rudis PR-1116 ss-1]|nr:hypothetical protein K474DRAFT_1661466 [Panus rudis PR-1116 ss-1]
MDQAAKKLLETVTIETLHAHNFSRSSTQAHFVLTDLLHRYLTVLATTCARYAEHAGRLHVIPKDAVSALGDLGVDVDELSDYCATEAREMSRYAVHTARRMEDLHELKASLMVGMREDKDDSIPLVYGPVPEDIMSGDEEDYKIEESDSESLSDVEMSISPKQHENNSDVAMNIDIPDVLPERPDEHTSPRPTTPPLPLSPISNPPSPSRKRRRTARWDAPEYVPSFLPPFPTNTPRHTPSPPPLDLPPPTQTSTSSPVKVERAPSPLPQAPQETTSSSSKAPGDWYTPTPYELSGLASQPTWHLPNRPPTPPSSPPTHNLPMPMPERALYEAYHYILTHHPKQNLDDFNPGPVNLGKYKVALELVRENEKEARWDAPTTLFASTTPNLPRVAAVAPTYPIQAGRLPEDLKEIKDKKGGKDKDEPEAKLPVTMPRAVAGIERFAPMVSQPVSRIPALARELLPGAVYSRTTRLSHPNVLLRGKEKVVYGTPIGAPWNANPNYPFTATGVSKEKEKAKQGEDESMNRVLPDAGLYATWNWEEKKFDQPLPPARRARLGTVTLGGSAKARGRSESRGL